jgi:hypothetical protein
LRKKEQEKREVAAALAVAQQQAANPLSAAWGEGQGLIEALDSAPDQEDARLRLRSNLRRRVDSIYLLIVPRGLNRFCAVQIWFAGGKKQRSYLIYHRPTHATNRVRVEGGWSVRSFAGETEDGLDLRQPADVQELTAYLTSLDLPSAG